ncbi:MAG: SCO family protein [Candidatus Acidiferrum sp.]
MNQLRSVCLVVAVLLLCSTASAQLAPSNAGKASQGLPPILQNVGFEPTLNAHLPLDLAFVDETGRSVQLRDYFGQRPVLLAFVYYGCPMLCDELEQGVVGTLHMLSFNPGRDYQVVFISFDPRETAAMATQKKELAMKQFRRPDTANGWHFLTGSQPSIDALTKAANFRYAFDKKSGLFAHASGIMLLTPDGRISRYFYGVEFPSRDVRLGLVDASAGKIGTPIDHILLYCFQYDPSSARYSASILKILRLGGVLTIVFLVAGMLIFRRRDLGAGLKKKS